MSSEAGVGPATVSSSSPGFASPNTAAPYSASTPSYPAIAPAVGVRYAGFWIRVVAAIIDAVILRVIVSPFHIIFGGLGLAGMMAGLPHLPLAILGGGVTFIALFFGSWLYEAFMESSSYQATLGKMIFGLKVTDLNGNRICFSRATGRHFAKILSAMISASATSWSPLRSASRDCTTSWPELWCGAHSLIALN
jgi:uncharacterized RDD family membrane protein YckC